MGATTQNVAASIVLPPTNKIAIAQTVTSAQDMAPVREFD